MEHSLPDSVDLPARDLGDATLDRLLGTDRDLVALPPLPTAQFPKSSRLPFWTRVYLYVLGATAPVDDSPKSLHDRVVDAVIVTVIIVLLGWIAYLTLRGWALYQQY